jgi:hypothetical protein
MGWIAPEPRICIATVSLSMCLNGRGTPSWRQV